MNNENLEVVDIELGVFLKILSKYKWRVIIFSIVGTAVAAIAAFQLKPIFQASATILVQADESKLINDTSFHGIDPSEEKFMQTQLEILKSKRISADVIISLSLNELDISTKNDHGIVGRFKQLGKSFLPKEFSDNGVVKQEKNESKSIQMNEDVFRWFSNSLDINPINNTRVFTIKFSDADPYLATKIVNAIGDTYIESFLEDKMQSSEKAMQWLNGQLISISKQLQAAEAKLQQFVASEQIADMRDGIQTVNEVTIKILNEKLLDVRNERIELQNLVNQIEFVEASSSSSILEKQIDSDIIRELKVAEITAVSNFVELDQKYGPKHPRMLAARAEVEQVKERLESQIRREKERLNSELAALQDTEDKLELQVNDAQNKFILDNEKESQFRLLKGDVERISDLKDVLTTKLQEMNLTSDFDSSIARFVDKASVPSRPVAPNKLLIVASTFLTCLFLGYLFFLVKEFFNNRVRNTLDVESKLRQRMLGLIPKQKISGKRSSLPAYHFFDTGNRAFIESVKSIKTSILLSSVDDQKGVFMIASSVPSEGKSTTALNLAFSLNLTEKVLIIDGDLRKHSLSSLLNFDSTVPGLADLLKDSSINIERCIHTDQESRLDIMPAGISGYDYLENLSVDKLNNVLKKLRKTYDKIIIDTPPCHAVSDAFIISKTADSVIFLVRADYTNFRTAKSALERLVDGGADIQGIVLNMVVINQKEKDYLGYYDYYGYS